jgi:hypothetical protein
MSACSTALRRACAQKAGRPKILDVLNEHRVAYRDRVLNPVTTIWGFR